MLYLAFLFLVSTFVVGIMTIGAASSGSPEALTNLFYVSAGLFLLFFVVDTVVRSYKSKKANREYAKKLEEAIRGNSLNS